MQEVIGYSCLRQHLASELKMTNDENAVISQSRNSRMEKEDQPIMFSYYRMKLLSCALFPYVMKNDVLTRDRVI